MTRHSFTLTELLVVIAIIVILAGILISGIGYAGRRADEAKTKATMLEFENALDKFKSEKGYYPICKDAKRVWLMIKNEHLYLVLSTKPSDDDGAGADKNEKPISSEETNALPFYDKATKRDYMNAVEVTGATPVSLVDPWGQVFYYQCPGKHNKTSYDLWSKGADQKTKTSDHQLDDVVNWGSAQ